MPRNNKLVAINRWKKVREKERAAFASSNAVRIEKAALLGFLAGDGSVKKYAQGAYVRHRVCFYPDDKHMLDVYLSFFSLVYSKHPVVKQKKKFYDVALYSKSVTEDLCRAGTFGLYTWAPPMFNDSLEAAAWLRAFFSAEAYVGKKEIRIQTVNAVGMKSISELLYSFNIEHATYVYRPKKESYSEVHIISIRSETATRLYFEQIGFWHSKKTTALRKALYLKAQP